MPRKQWVLANFSLLLLIAGAGLFVGCSDDDPVDIEPAANFTNTVVIHTEPDYLNVTWSLAIPGGNTVSAQGDAVMEDMPSGDYTISWIPVEGWSGPKPNPRTKTIDTNKQIDFLGDYFLKPGSMFINVTPGDLQAAWTVSNEDGFELSGTGDSTLLDLMPGDYEILWQPVDGWTNPDQEAADQGTPYLANATVTIFGTLVERTYRQSVESIFINPEPNDLNAPWSLVGSAVMVVGSSPEVIVNETGTGDFILTDGWPNSIPTETSSMTYTITWNDLAGYTAPSATTYTMSRGISLEMDGIYRQLTGSASINVEPSGVEAPWTLMGPSRIERNGMGDEDLSDLAPGDYTLVWGDVPGWQTPDSETLEVSASAAASFAGTYGASLVLNPMPTGFAAPWQLSSTGGFSTSGTGAAVFNDLDAASYTITWGAVDGWAAPAAETVAFGSTGTVVSGEYTQNAMTVFVRPEPSGLGAPWTLSGPGGFSATGTGQSTVEIVNAGIYTLSWESLAGWTSPGPIIQEIEAGANSTLRAQYLHDFGFTLVVGGEFEMGTASEACASTDESAHDVTLTNDILMQTTETSNGTFVEVLQWAVDNGYALVNGDRIYDTLDDSTILLLNLSDAELMIDYEDGVFSTDYPDYPMVEVSWYAAAAFCDWLSLHKGLVRAYNHSNWLCNGYDPYNATGYRLPTEAEWEFACRAGSDEGYTNTDIDSNFMGCFVDDLEALNSVCWFSENASSMSHVVASKSPNSWGLFDMHGNVREWCNDRYRGNYCGTTCPDEDPVGPSMGDTRVLRGGYFFSSFVDVRSGARAESTPANASNTAGFRVVLTDR